MKNFLFYILCFVLIIGTAFGFSEYFYGSTGILKSGIADVAGIKSFEDGGKTRLLEDAEGEVEEEIIKILSKAERKNRGSVSTEPIEGNRTDYEIELYFSDIYEHYFVYLGEKSFVYDIENGKRWEIINAEEIIPEIDAIFAK
ncbi:MAG: hypothetical protein IJO22_05295 [Oscillospiraceae bacterium]|nr:hypothetical protein [Oscillospiraceae bacterium]